jgi:hypothetical protein
MSYIVSSCVVLFSNHLLQIKQTFSLYIIYIGGFNITFIYKSKYNHNLFIEKHYNCLEKTNVI